MIECNCQQKTHQPFEELGPDFELIQLIQNPEEAVPICSQHHEK